MKTKFKFSYLIIFFLMFFLQSCDNKNEQKIVYTINNNQDLDFNNIKNDSLINCNFITLKIYLNDYYQMDNWKEKYDLENMTSEEIDVLIREKRNESKSYYVNYNLNFIMDNQLYENINGVIHYSSYSPIITIEYNDFKDIEKDNIKLNEILKNDSVKRIEFYI